MAVRSLLRTRKRLYESAVLGAEQFAAALDAGMGDRSDARGGCRPQANPLARHPRVQTRVWIEPIARQLDVVSAIGDLYRFDRFVAPAKLWDDLRARFPELFNAA